jgi:hypothetical protein
MREIMLIDTATRLPEVLQSLRKELSICKSELEVLEGKKRYRDPGYLKVKVGNFLQLVCDRIGDYLDGDLETAKRFPDTLKDLDDELALEEDSEWSDQQLGPVSLEDEENWRKIIDKMLDEGMPDHLRAEQRFLGGKQFQRAKELLKAAMAEAFPNISEIKEYVPSGAGYLQGGLQRENW